MADTDGPWVARPSGTDAGPSPASDDVYLMYRKSKKLGPLRVTANKSGLSLSGGAGPLRQSRPTSGTKGTTVSGRGARWIRSRSR